MVESHLPTLLGYIGPGGGITLLGPLLGVFAAIFGSIAMIAFWPLRMWLRKMRATNQPLATEQPSDA